MTRPLDKSETVINYFVINEIFFLALLLHLQILNNSKYIFKKYLLIKKSYK
jgi:hypothetical protein